MTKKAKTSGSGIGFSLQTISLDQFAVFEEDYKAEEKTRFDVALTFGINAEHKMFRVSSRIAFSQQKRPFLLIEGSSEFVIEHEAWESFILDDSASIVFPHGFVAHLAALTIGSIRGMLYVKTQNTQFNQFLIPTINVAEMVEKDVRFDMKKGDVLS
ncbi:MAG: hypothetical protein UMU76_01785 [Prosthecochloris sp.]|nr:hypothetical protein [Prosthecochloris sp.]